MLACTCIPTASKYYVDPLNPPPLPEMSSARSGLSGFLTYRTYDNFRVADNTPRALVFCFPQPCFRPGRTLLQLRESSGCGAIEEKSERKISALDIPPIYLPQSPPPDLKSSKAGRPHACSWLRPLLIGGSLGRGVLATARPFLAAVFSGFYSNRAALAVAHAPR